MSLTAVKFGENGDIPGLIGGEVGAPGVVLIQEWWGINQNVKDLGARMVGNGFRVLIPDICARLRAHEGRPWSWSLHGRHISAPVRSLTHAPPDKGKVGTEVEEAKHLMDGLDWGLATKEICAAAAFLKKEGSKKARFNGKKCLLVGITGFCMGGALSLIGAASSPDIVCAAPFYGVPPMDCANVKKPVLAQFGSLDDNKGFSDPAAAKKLEEALKAGGAEHEVVIYDGVGHAFMNDSPMPFKTFAEREKAQPGVVPYNKEVGDKAWDRLTAFLKKHTA